jgi:hypothetical protein
MGMRIKGIRIMDFLLSVNFNSGSHVGTRGWGVGWLR